MASDLENAQKKIARKGKIWTFSPSWALPPETAARTFAEALAVQAELDKSYPEYKWHVENGPKAWDTQKPTCYLVKASLKS